MENKYTSPSTGKLCTASQYLSEVVCTRKAKKDGNDLAFKFWNKKQKDSYKATIVSICKLIDEFGEKEVVSYFLNDGKFIYSAGWYTPHKWIKENLIKYVQKYRAQKEYESSPAKEEQKEEVETEQIEITIPKPKKKKTLFGVLNGEEKRT
jgi:hypothetical protein